jgi:hypothetical protein
MHLGVIYKYFGYWLVTSCYCIFVWTRHWWLQIGIAADLLFATDLRPVGPVEYSTVVSDLGFTS